MKPLIILLLDRGFAPQTVSEILGEPIANVYYHNKKYKEAAPILKEILNKTAVRPATPTTPAV